MQICEIRAVPATELDEDPDSIEIVESYRDAFEKAKLRPRIQKMVSRKTWLTARSPKGAISTTSWWGDHEHDEDVGALANFERDWVVVDEDEGPVRFSAVVMQSKKSMVEDMMIRFDAGVSSDLHALEEKEDFIDEAAAMTWCEKYVAGCIEELNLEVK